MHQTSPTYIQSALCTILLVALSMITIPATAILTILAGTYSFLNHTHISPTPIRRTVLITGARNTKCLFLARAFHREGCRVVVAEEPDWFHLNMTRFSNSVDSYYRLPDPGDSPEEYKSAILYIVDREKVDLFLPCSSPSHTILDAEVALDIARSTTKDACSSFIPHPTLTSILHWKHDFISLCSELGMVVPESVLVSSVRQAAEFLHSSTPHRRNNQYITKCLAFDDLARTDMTPLPLATITQTTDHLHKLPLPISERHTYVVQRLLHGPEYCTHAAVRDGELVAFVTCRSSDMLMRYVDVKSRFSAGLEQERRKEYAVGAQAEEWTKTFLQRWKAKLQREAGNGGSSFTTELTGHFCMDFILNEADGKLYPIECNPRAHTAVTLFTSVRGLASHYLGATPGTARPSPTTPPQSWIAHSLPLSLALLLPTSLARILHPCLSSTSTTTQTLDPTISPQPEHSSPLDILLQYVRGAEVDPVWDVYDPIPFFVLIHLAWPWALLKVMVSGKAWSRINASTMRVWGAKAEEPEASDLKLK